MLSLIVNTIKYPFDNFVNRPTIIFSNFGSLLFFFIIRASLSRGYSCWFIGIFIDIFIV